jgi:hypothetical protein
VEAENMSATATEALSGVVAGFTSSTCEKGDSVTVFPFS